jgi:hypothetical protein
MPPTSGTRLGPHDIMAACIMDKQLVHGTRPRGAAALEEFGE